MTSRLERVNGRGTSHTYTLDGSQAIGVTTALKEGLPAPALMYWASGAVAEYAVTHREELQGLRLQDQLDRLKGAPWAERDQRAARGTDVHGLGERLVHGKPVDVPAELQVLVEAYARFLDHWQIEPVATEAVVAHTTWGYAGTGDLWCRIGRLGNQLALTDLKTARDVYAKDALQLAAYRYANLWQPQGPVSETDRVPEVEACYVIHLLSDSVRLVPVQAGEAEHKAFLYVLQVARWRDRHDVRKYRGKGEPRTVDAPLIGEAIA